MKQQTPILEFQGEYRWLSNFTKVPVQYGGFLYPSTEHAYMAAKVESEETTFTDWKGQQRKWREWVRSPEAKRPGTVKKMSRFVPLREDWETRKVGVMLKLLRQKFAQEPFRTQLLGTGTAVIQEGNRWGDVFWGVDLRTGKGENILGKLIMQVRDELQK